MKRKLLSVSILILLLAGCAGLQYQSFQKNAYRVLNGMKISYDTITDSVIDLHKTGFISDKDYADIKKYADTFADAQNGAIDAINAYSQGLGSGEDLSAKLTGVSVALTRLISVASPYLNKGDKQ